MFPNAKPSEVIAVLATIDPISQGAGTAVSGWVAIADFYHIMAVIDLGVMTATSTVDAKFQQATTSGGAGAKDISPAKSITQLLAAGGNNRQVLLSIRGQELDVANSFNYVQLSVTVAAAASVISAVLLGVNPRFAIASDFNQAGVAQVV
jgi:hypothetical protein